MSTRSRNLPLGLRCAKMGLAYFENGRVVMIPYLCISANSTVRSSLRLMGTGRLCVYTGLSFLGVRHTLNWLFIPMSSRWRAKMSLNSFRVDSRFSRSSLVINKSFHLNNERNCDLNFLSCLGSSSSDLCSSRSLAECVVGWVCVFRFVSGIFGSWEPKFLFCLFRRINLHQCINVRNNIIVIGE